MRLYLEDKTGTYCRTHMAVHHYGTLVLKDLTGAAEKKELTVRPRCSTVVKDYLSPGDTLF